MKLLMGVGNEMRGDDAVGVYVARNFHKDGWHVIVAGQVPEDFTSEIKKLRPELLVLVDAALMGQEPGAIRRIPESKIPSVAFSTHGMPLTFFVTYLREYVGDIVLVGIEPAQMEFGEPITSKVKAAGDTLISILKNEEIEKISVL